MWPTMHSFNNLHWNPFLLTRKGEKYGLGMLEEMGNQLMVALKEYDLTEYADKYLPEELPKSPDTE